MEKEIKMHNLYSSTEVIVPSCELITMLGKC